MGVGRLLIILLFGCWGFILGVPMFLSLAWSYAILYHPISNLIQSLPQTESFLGGDIAFCGYDSMTDAPKGTVISVSPVSSCGGGGIIG